MDNASFTNRLVDSQVESFLDKLYPKDEGFDISFSLKKKYNSAEEYWAVKISHFGWDTPIFVQLEEYSSTLENSGEWIKFLITIFGEEYKKMFSEKCISIFEGD